MSPLQQRVVHTVKRGIRTTQRRALEPLARQQRALLQTTQLQLALRYREQAAAGGPLPSYRDVGFGVYCDADEDGILLFLLSVVGSGRKQLVELGSASADASNSSNLIVHHGWSGLLVDADEASVENARLAYERLGVIAPAMIGAWLTAENVDGLIREHGPSGEVDLLSIDVDGNDYWLWRAIESITPRVVVIEYQDILGPERSVTIPYDPEFSLSRYEVNATQNNYVGASLRAMVKLGEAKGYRLVATNSYGFNAFFLRDDLATDLIPTIAVEDGFPHAWNEYGMRERWPLVADMPWQEV
ncbi:MAG: hypothetical protein M3389_01125 [Actinomycetota bacterium]|nr:hypothetical protein [Actinomycetota bacterium]